MTATFLPAGSIGYGEIEVRLGSSRPSHAIYMRRRLAMALVVVGLLVLVGLAASKVLADRGAVPASSPAIRPAQTGAQPATATATGAVAVETPSSAYVVQPGDTLWALAERFHGSIGITDYVDRLIAANGGTALQRGQALILP